MLTIFGCIIGAFNVFCICTEVKGEAKGHFTAYIPTVINLLCSVCGGFAVYFMLADA
jgi:hypothetical protein